MKKFVWLLTFLVLLGASAYVAYLLNVNKGPLYVKETYPGDIRLWENLVSTDEITPFENEAMGVVIPHHLIAADKIAQFYADLAASKKPKPSMIVILGPNHYESHPELDVQTCMSCIYETTMGNVEVDKDFVSLMKKDGIAHVSDDSFAIEHAIFAHTPFIKKYFPDAKIVPILSQWKMGQEKSEKLAAWLHNNLPEDALVIASVDFSHYIPVNAADFHDQSSLATIKNFDFENVYDLEIDSPDSIYTIMKLMELRGATLVDQVAHTNSQDYMSALQKETTSHQFLTFSKGQVDREFGLGILSFGNMADAADLGISSGWNWDRNYDQTADQTVSKYLKNIRSSEDRFLTGSDFLIFDVPVGDCRIDTQNFMDIAFCKMSEENFEDEKEALRKASASADIVYVQYQFSSNALSDERKAQLKTVADLGADIVIGKGASEIGSFEVYEGSLIFYSLGDFVAQNKFVTELDSSTKGLIVGIWVTPKNYKVYLFRVATENAYPKFLEYSDNEDFFEKYFLDIESEFKDPGLGMIEIAF